MEAPDTPQILWGIFPYTRDFSDADLLISGAYGMRGGKKAVELSAEDLERRVHEERSNLVKIWQRQPSSDPRQAEIDQKEFAREMFGGWHIKGLSSNDLSQLHSEYLNLPPAREEGLDLPQWKLIIENAVGPGSRWACADAERLFNVADIDGVGAVGYPQAVRCISILLSEDIEVTSA